MSVVISLRVENKMSEDIFVYASKTKEWQIGDFVTEIAFLAAGLSELKAIADIAELPDTIESIKDLQEVLKVAGKLLRATEKIGANSAAVAQKIMDLFKQKATQISPGGSRAVWELSVFEMFSVSSIMGLIPGVRTVELVITTNDGKKVSHFTTNETLSWVATDGGVVPASDGHGEPHTWETSE